MRKEGKLTLQALASVLSTHHKNTDMSDIHLLVKRRLAALHLGEKLADFPAVFFFYLVMKHINIKKTNVNKVE